MAGNPARPKAAASGGPPSRQEMLEVEHALYRAQIAGSVADLRPMLGSNLLYIHSTGIAETREEYLDGVAGGLYEYGAIESRDARVQLFSDVVIMNGVVDMTVSAHGAAKTLIQLLFCLVWIREDSAWKLDFRQATRIPSRST